MSVIKSTPDILYIDLCIIPKNSNMGPQSMCSIMKIMDYGRLDTLQSPVSRFQKYMPHHYNAKACISYCMLFRF